MAGIEVTVRDGRVGRVGGPAGVTPQGHGEVLETREAGEPFYVGDKLTLADGTEVVAIGVDNHITPIWWKQTVHIADIFDEPDSTPN